MILTRSSPRRVAVFRALQLGDMLCAVPALRSLRAQLPHAEITLVGLPWAAAFARRFDCYLDDFIPFPGYPGLPEQAPDCGAWESFVGDVRSREFDLAIQMHGSGLVSNTVVAAFGAREVAGFVPDASSAAALPGLQPYPTGGHEIHRLLQLVESLGAPSRGDELEFPLDAADRQSQTRIIEELGGAPYACIHPGSRQPSRRWPPERFAAVADGLAALGYRVVLTGSADERELTRAVATAMSDVPIDTTGATSLGSLGALLDGASVVLSNDTGVAHVAVGVGAPSVVVSCGSDAERWSPLDAAIHRTVAEQPACRPCAHPECPYEGHPCALGIEPARVLAEAECAMAAARSRKEVLRERAG